MTEKDGKGRKKTEKDGKRRKKTEKDGERCGGGTLEGAQKLIGMKFFFSRTYSSTNKIWNAKKYFSWIHTKFLFNWILH